LVILDFLPIVPERWMTLMLLRRGTMLWLLARGALAASGSAGHALGLGGSAFTFAPAATFALLVVVGALAVLESRRVNEHRFFANLGVSPAAVGIISLLPCVIGEVVIRLIPFP
jgi:hypothetical protein